MRGVRNISNGVFQGYFGSAGPGETKCFRSELAAAKWAQQMRLSKRLIGARQKTRALPRGATRDAPLPVGLTYSNGKWYARSPRWHHQKIVRVFTESEIGRAHV